MFGLKPDNEHVDHDISYMLKNYISGTKILVDFVCYSPEKRLQVGGGGEGSRGSVFHQNPKIWPIFGLEPDNEHVDYDISYMLKNCICGTNRVSTVVFLDHCFICLYSPALQHSCRFRLLLPRKTSTSREGG